MITFEPSIHLTPKVGKRDDLWWRGAVIYQIYPRSFVDSNGDGIGDLAGITGKLDYVASLGVDAVWISPFMKSPQADYGYDVADYQAVDPMFGTLDDFDALLARAHELGLKVLIDFVPSHTSDQHAWFTESRSSQSNAKADWYVWADPKPDGTAPNNWMSVFGGPAWQFDTRRGQYYLHNFLAEQPDLNFHNPQVIAALMAQAEFWLERGVDGFRVDAIDFGVHDPELKDNPPRPPATDQHGATTPFNMQYQQWNKARPQLSELFFKPLFRLSERYGATCLLGEISGEFALQRMADYSCGGGLDMAYSFELLTCPSDQIRPVIETVEAHLGEGWPCYAFSNHDVYRSATRFGGPNPPHALLVMIPQLLTSIRGSVCLYQGEELGLGETELTFEQLKDPVGIEFWPKSKGRDGCRTPIPWTTQSPHGGFSEGEPWLPVGETNHTKAVDRQNDDPDSVLNHTRRFLAWRREQPALVHGSIEFIDVPDGLVAFERLWGEQAITCLFNLTDQVRSAVLPGLPETSSGPSDHAKVTDDRIDLPAYATCFVVRADRNRAGAAPRAA